MPAKIDVIQHLGETAVLLPSLIVREGPLDPKVALARSMEIDFERARVTRFSTPIPAIAMAVSASPGVATGRIAFDSSRAKAMAAESQPVILVRHSTSTDDVAGFAVSAGILTAVGGRTAHAAVVARQLGKVYLVGCRGLVIDAAGHSAEIAGTKVVEGDWISLDGDTGAVMPGRLDIVSEVPQAELAALERWRQS